VKLRYYCHFGYVTGYSRAAHDYLMALLHHSDVDIEIVPIDAAPDMFALEPRYLELMQWVNAEPRGSCDVALYHTTPWRLRELAIGPTMWPDVGDVPRVALTTWETDPMPSHVAAGLARYNHVIVPSVFVAQCADDLPWSSVVPHCFDPDFWGFPERYEPEPPFSFYTVGAWNERKNPLGVLRAYLHEFRRRDEVRLVIVAADADLAAVRSLLARSGLPEEDWPGLFVPRRAGPLTQEQLLELHAGAGCFVSATRGEGFGLGHFEAAIMGRPVVTSLRGGQSEFLARHPFCSFDADLRGLQRTPCFAGESQLGVVERDGQLYGMARADISNDVDCGQLWYEPDLVSIAQSMRYIASAHREIAKRWDEVRAYRGELERDYGYATIGPLLARTLEEICERHRQA
jgi:glycosyltransferase involved in cell wall biosynthesis